MWPCPSADHPGTPRLFEGGRPPPPTGRIHPQVVEWRAPMDPSTEVLGCPGAHRAKSTERKRT